MKIVNKKKIVLLLFVSLLILSAITLTYKSNNLDDTLKKQVQIILNDNNIPLEIEKIKLEGKLNEILSGHIPKAEIILKVKKSDIKLKILTSIEYKLNASQIEFIMDSAIHSDAIADLKLKTDLRLHFQRTGSKIIIGNIDSNIEINSTKKTSYQSLASLITIQKFKISSNVNLDLTKSPLVLTATSKFDLDQISDSTQPFGIPELKFTLNNQIILSDEPIFIIQKLNLSTPTSLNLYGAITKNKIDLNFNHKSNLSTFIESIQSIYSIPVLDKISGNGTFQMQGTATGSIDNPTINGSVSFNAEILKLEKIFNSQSLTFKKILLNSPISYPPEEFVGKLSIDEIAADLFNFKNINFLIKGIESEIQLILNQKEANSSSITIPFLESSFKIHQLKFRIPLSPEASGHHDMIIPGIPFPALISMAVSGGPFQIAEIQKSFCILPSTPFEGKIRFEYPRIFNSQSGFHFFGSTTADILGGTIDINSLRYFWNKINPTIYLSAAWNDLDLHEIGEISHFGDMRGSLNGSLINSEYALTDLGPIPLSYDLTIQGAKRSGKTISFYGRAVENILELLGSRKADMPWFAQFGINLSMKFRNWFPATADYMGFRAKTSGGWTELYTLDPPNEKNHYFLSGTAFKIPLNTHGVYPAIMKTDAFQGWLWGMLDYFNKLSDEKVKTEKPNDASKCIPFWEAKK